MDSDVAILSDSALIAELERRGYSCLRFDLPDDFKVEDTNFETVESEVFGVP
ncbi:hypothetical protein [Alistipes indistinctus]|jgi:hypothetical protein|uniref:hypothetical protein n=1 Tax=Alistipes indistinctus TaxID=626932 RepID=UPI001C704CB7|nr:hypothetical protein [Alistipes indistinctus]DAM75285.1 MAG TPA: alpha/beta hydrolase family protein [Caudoviricetes sp.]